MTTQPARTLYVQRACTTFIYMTSKFPKALHLIRTKFLLLLYLFVCRLPHSIHYSHIFFLFCKCVMFIYLFFLSSHSVAWLFVVFLYFMFSNFYISVWMSVCHCLPAYQRMYLCQSMYIVHFRPIWMSLLLCSMCVCVCCCVAMCVRIFFSICFYSTCWMFVICFRLSGFEVIIPFCVVELHIKTRHMDIQTSTQPPTSTFQMNA